MVRAPPRLKSDTRGTRPELRWGLHPPHYSPGVERPSPAEYQPQLTPLEHAWRYAAMLAISLISWSVLFDGQVHPTWMVALDLAIGGVCYVLVYFRREQPLFIAVIVNLMV